MTYTNTDVAQISPSALRQWSQFKQRLRWVLQLTQTEDDGEATHDWWAETLTREVGSVHPSTISRWKNPKLQAAPNALYLMGIERIRKDEIHVAWLLGFAEPVTDDERFIERKIK